MQDFEKLGAFYLGRTSNNLLLYDSKDLVTHAVCVGMTGSGKTGLCIDVLEEAAIDGVPAIVIDPKGDIANLLLQFPQLRPEDFRPWLDPEEAQRQNITLDQLAGDQAERWRRGLAEWGQTPERVQRLHDAADFAIYTPGSSAGLPLSALKSFEAPSATVMEDRELLRDRINGTAAAVLSLLGIDADPMKSREHILLANIFEKFWRDGRSVAIEELIHAIQQPPMSRVGVVDIESFYPAKERFELAMSLNNLVAAPGFDAWLEGEPLDAGRLLYTPEGKPRISILSIAHLNDTERMFFVTLVLNEVLSWMRSQSGTSSLRAILYMDEIFGYFPPVANPPSKRPLLILLKQARAFGVGVVLATQNPVDLDYKGLANTGTWFIGRLQTERDKERLIDGLEGALTEAGSGFDRAQTERLLAGLGQRMFLMNNVHESAPVVFESRWALSYLRGPLTRAQIRMLTQQRKVSPPPAGEKPAAPGAASAAAGRPILPPDVPQTFIPVRGSHRRIVYQPMILGSAKIRFTDAKAKIDFMKEAVFLTPIHDDALPVEWEECFEAPIDPNTLEREPAAGAEFGPLPATAARPKSYTAWSKDLAAWIYSHQVLNIYCSPAVKMSSRPDESEREFRMRVQQANREARDAAVDKLRKKYETKFTTLEDRLRRAEQAVERQREQARAATLNTAMDIGAGVFGALFGRKKLSTAATTGFRRASRAWQYSSDAGRAEETVAAVTQQIHDLEAQLEEEIRAMQTEFDEAPVEVAGIKPKKTNIQIRLVTLAWAPYAPDATGNVKPVWQ